MLLLSVLETVLRRVNSDHQAGRFDPRVTSWLNEGTDVEFPEF